MFYFYIFIVFYFNNIIENQMKYKRITVNNQ